MSKESWICPICGVPNEIHGTSCGWECASIIMNPKNAEQQDWHQKALLAKGMGSFKDTIMDNKHEMELTTQEEQKTKQANMINKIFKTLNGGLVLLDEIAEISPLLVEKKDGYEYNIGLKGGICIKIRGVHNDVKKNYEDLVNKWIGFIKAKDRVEIKVGIDDTPALIAMRSSLKKSTSWTSLVLREGITMSEINIFCGDLVYEEYPNRFFKSSKGNIMLSVGDIIERDQFGAFSLSVRGNNVSWPSVETSKGR